MPVWCMGGGGSSWEVSSLCANVGCLVHSGTFGEHPSVSRLSDTALMQAVGQGHDCVLLCGKNAPWFVLSSTVGLEMLWNDPTNGSNVLKKVFVVWCADGVTNGVSAKNRSFSWSARWWEYPRDCDHRAGALNWWQNADFFLLFFFIYLIILFRSLFLTSTSSFSFSFVFLSLCLSGESNDHGVTRLYCQCVCGFLEQN